MPRVLAAIILHQLPASQSAAFQSFCAALRQSKDLQDVYRLIVFDNSPKSQTLPAGCAEAYLHDPTNPGLAKPYTLALEQAASADLPWLMLLDQDTTVTLAYLEEVVHLTVTQAGQLSIAALVPKLMQAGAVQSPHKLLGLRRAQSIPLQQAGPATEELQAFNSGAVLRVATIQQVGGFPLSYPLDFLDHATFRLLQRGGKRLYVMSSSLSHDLSLLELYSSNQSPITDRMRTMFRTEIRFYREMGTPLERFLHRMRLLYRAAKGVRLGSVARVLLFLRLAVTFAREPEENKAKQ